MYTIRQISQKTTVAPLCEWINARAKRLNCTCAKENHCKRVQWLQTDSSYICAFQMPWSHFVKTSVTRNWRQYQFSYRKNKSTEDATLLYNNLVVEHLENKNAHVRSVFTDLSSAFNTLKPDIVINKPRTLNVSPTLCTFILHFLTNREQRVRINDILSTVLSISTGVPQGCVFSAILFIIYTNELRSRFRNCHLIKYADDTVIVGLISNNDESEYNEQISEVVLWCKAQHMLLNAAYLVGRPNRVAQIKFDPCLDLLSLSLWLCATKMQKTPTTIQSWDLPWPTLYQFTTTAEYCN